MEKPDEAQTLPILRRHPHQTRRLSEMLDCPPHPHDFFKNGQSCHACGPSALDHIRRRRLESNALQIPIQ